MCPIGTLALQQLMVFSTWRRSEAEPGMVICNQDLAVTSVRVDHGVPENIFAGVHFLIVSTTVLRASYKRNLYRILNIEFF